MGHGGGFPCVDDPEHRDLWGRVQVAESQLDGGQPADVLIGERLTVTNTCHCVNSLSMQFVAADPRTLGSP